MSEKSASEQIDDIVRQHGGWKAEVLFKLRQIINQADPDITEEVKWKTASRPEGLPVWYHNGMVCLAEVWKDNVKLIFVKGVHLDDPHGLFNSRLKSSTDRAIEIKEGDNPIDAEALKTLVSEAVEFNSAKK